MSKYSQLRNNGGSYPNRKAADSHKGLFVALAVAALVIVIGGGIAGLMYYEKKGFDNIKVKTLKFEYRRPHFAAGTADGEGDKNPKPEVVFSAENIEKYELGVGVEIPFVVESPTGEETTKTFTLATFKEHEEKDNPVRRADIQNAKSELTKLVADWKSYKPVTWNVEVHIDLTGRWGQPLIDQVTDTLEKTRLESFGNKTLKDRIDMGDEINFVAYKIRDTDFVDGRPAETIPTGKSGRGTSEYSKVERTLNWVWSTADKRGTETSSIATALFNAMDENVGKPNRVVLIFSDLVENDAATVLMYDKDLKLLKEKKYDEVESKLLSRRKLQSKGLPKLAGVDVHAFGPKTGVAADTIRMAMDFYQSHLMRLSKAHLVRLTY